jgi:hypothetical protein
MVGTRKETSLTSNGSVLIAVIFPIHDLLKFMSTGQKNDLPALRQSL